MTLARNPLGSAPLASDAPDLGSGITGTFALSDAADVFSASGANGLSGFSALQDAADAWAIVGSNAASGTLVLADAADVFSASGEVVALAPVLIVKVAPFYSTDTITSAGFQLYNYVAGVLTSDGAHTTTGIDSIPNITNGYCVGLTDDHMTLDSDGGYRGMIVWDSGGGSPFYVGDEVYVPATVVSSSGGGGWDEIIEGTYTAGDLLRVLAAVAAGKTNISGTTVTFRDVTDSSDIVEAQMQKSKRITVTITP